MPSEITLPLECDGNHLQAGAALPDGAPKAAVLLLHGIPSVMPPAPDDLGYPGLARSFAEAGYAAGWLDMRAVRSSEGFFSIEGWVRDALTGLDALRELDGVTGAPTVVVGSSAGGAVAAEMTRRGAPVDALVLLAAPATWVSIESDPRLAVERIRLGAGMELAPEVMSSPEDWAAEFESVQTEDAIAELEVPVLVMHGTADDVVPVDHAEAIARRARRAEKVIIEGGGHQLRRDDGAIERVLEWLNRTL